MHAPSFGWGERVDSGPSRETIADAIDRARNLFNQQGQDDAGAGGRTPPAGRASPTALQRAPTGMPSPVPRHRGPEEELYRMHEVGGEPGHPSASSHAAALLGRQSPQLPERRPPPRGVSPTLPMRQPSGMASPQFPTHEPPLGQMSPYMPSRQPGDGLGACGAGSPSAPSAAGAYSSAARRTDRSPSALTRGTPQMPMRHPVGTPQPAMRQPAMGTPQPSMRQPSGAMTPSLPSRQPTGASHHARGASPCAVGEKLHPLVEEEAGSARLPCASPGADAESAGFADAASEAAKAWLQRLRGSAEDGSGSGPGTPSPGMPSQVEDPFEPPTKPHKKQPEVEMRVERRDSRDGEVEMARHHLMPLREASPVLQRHPSDQLSARDHGGFAQDAPQLLQRHESERFKGRDAVKNMFNTPQIPSRFPAAADCSGSAALPMGRAASPHIPARYPAAQESAGSASLPMERAPSPHMVARFPSDQKDSAGSAALPMERAASPHLPSRYPMTPQAAGRYPHEQGPGSLGQDRSPGEQKELIRQLLQSIGLTEPEAVQADGTLDRAAYQVMRENEYLRKTNDHIRHEKHSLEVKLKDLKVRNGSLEQQNEEFRSFCEGMNSGHPGTKMELSQLQAQLGCVMQIKESLNTENMELKERLKAAQAQPAEEDAEGKKTCVVCMDNIPNVVCLPCKHLGLCSICSQQCSLKQCPICRADIIDKMQVYLV